MTYLAIFPPLCFGRIKENVERREKTKIFPVKCFVLFYFILWYEFVKCHWLYSKNENLLTYYQVSL